MWHHQILEQRYRIFQVTGSFKVESDWYDFNYNSSNYCDDVVTIIGRTVSHRIWKESMNWILSYMIIFVEN